MDNNFIRWRKVKNVFLKSVNTAIFLKDPNEHKLNDVIREVLDQYNLQTRLAEARAAGSWGKVVGKLIAKYTRNVFVRDGILYVRIDSSVIKNEIDYSRKKIIDEINEGVGDEVIKEIKLL